MTTATWDKKNEYQQYVKQKGHPQKNMHTTNPLIKIRYEQH